MNTMESTVAMIKTLPEADLIKVRDFTLQLLSRQESIMTSTGADEAVGKFLKPMSREDFYRDVRNAEQEIADKKYSSAAEVFSELEYRYGF